MNPPKWKQTVPQCFHAALLLPWFLQRQLDHFTFSSELNLPTTQDKTRVYSNGARLSKSPVSLHFLKSGRQNNGVKARYTGNQSKCRWFRYSIAIILCNQQLPHNYIQIRFLSVSTIRYWSPDSPDNNLS